MSESVPFGLSKHGFKPKKYIDIIKELQTSWENSKVFKNPDFSKNNFLGQSLHITALQLESAWEELENIYYNCFTPTSSGHSLDLNTFESSTQRFPAKRGEVLIEFSGLPKETEIPVIFRVKNDNKNYSWLQQTPFTSDSEGKGRSIFVCELAGYFPEKQDSITSIVEGFATYPGVTCKNPSEAQPGKAEEQDANLRLRNIISRQSGNVGIPALKANLNNIKGVLSTRFTHEPYEYKEGKAVNARQIFVIGGDENEIFDVIFNNTGPEILYRGNVEGAEFKEKEVFDNEGNGYLIGFYRAIEQAIFAKVTVEVDETTDLKETDIKNKLLEYIRDLDSNIVIFNKMYSKISELNLIDFSLQIGTNKNDLKSKNINDIPESSIVTLPTENIQVSIKRVKYGS